MERIPFLSAYMLLAGFLVALAQPRLDLIVPNSGFPGDDIDVFIQGSETNFVDGFSTADFGEGISVNSFLVNSATTGTAKITILDNATPGLRTISVITGEEVASLTDGFEILEPTDNVTVQIVVVPVNVLYLSDLDPTNPAEAPLLFTVLLNNDNKERDLTVRLIASSANSGDLVIATRALLNVQPGAVLNFTNRDFDDYQTTPEGEDVLFEAAKTGMLPPDTYTYRIEVLDEDGKVIADDEGSTTTTNPTSELELISPGVLLGQTPEGASTAFPFFQWFGSAINYTFSIYAVLPGQTAAEDVVENKPVYTQSQIQTTFLSYPIFAETLLEGTTYAWQIVGEIETSSGTEMLPSEVFWFTVSTGGGLSPVERVEVLPNEVSLSMGESYQFQAFAYDANGEIITSSPQWRVVPQMGGVVNPNGLFTATDKPLTVAVVAQVGSVVDYATVSIQWLSPALNMDQFLRELFGLPQD